MRKVETDLNSSVALLRWSAGIEDSYSPKKKKCNFSQDNVEIDMLKVSRSYPGRIWYNPQELCNCNEKLSCL